MRKIRRGVVGAALLALALVAGACGSGDGTNNNTGAGGSAGAAGSVTVGSANFPEQLILGNMYADVLEEAGFTVQRKLNLGSREVTQPALESGEIDVMPEYVATLLEFVNEGAGEASGDVDASVEELRERLGDDLTVLEPSEAVDGNVFVMNEDRAEELGVESLSDLKGKAGDLVLGGPPECPQRPFCQQGLRDVYDLEFGSFKALDAGGPITKEALKQEQIDVALLFSTDPAIKTQNLRVLEDDESLQNADNVVPVVRSEVVTDALREALNELSATLTTEDLIELNSKVIVDKQDPDAVARAYLVEKDLIAG